MNVEYPLVLKEFLEVFSLGRLEFLPTIANFESVETDQNLLESPPKFYDNEYSGLFFHSSGTMILLWLITIFVYVVIKLIGTFLLRNSSNIFAKFIKHQIS